MNDCTHPYESLVPVGAIYRGSIVRAITVRCSRCGEAASFRLVSDVPEVRVSGLRVDLHAIESRIPQIPAESLELPPFADGGPRAESIPASSVEVIR